MQLITFGLNHATAPLALREQLAFGDAQVPDTLQQLRDSLGEQVTEVALLSTCNRTEFYCVTDKPHQLAETLPQWLAQQRQLVTNDLSGHVYQHTQGSAAQHAFRVASGLDSMVLGEPQILGQMKQAERLAREAGCLGTLLNQLFQRSFATAKEVRSQTEIGAHSVSMAAAGVRLAERIFERLADCAILFVGAGEMIELCATHFAAQQPKRMVIANRTRERAQTLAGKVGASVMSLNELPEHFAQFDIVVSCTASSLPIIGLGMVERALKTRKHKPMFMMDLAVPRDIESDVAQLDDVFLYTVDDLASVVQEGMEQRQAAVGDAERIIQQRVQDFMHWLEGRSALPVIQEMRQHAEQLRQAELSKAQKALQKALAQGTDPMQALEQLSHGLTNKFLHAPLQALQQADEHTRPHWLALLGELYGASSTRTDSSLTNKLTNKEEE
ncbi:glutamyl-tRNA reductase [Parvibium lacunae]|uniref:Glutamyl-tRNA reductase n=1 Tax=Parvibium lacunae TaxID=1888893 RepID=A0A368L548_9BURK|nr:glutamyl-tRNA reductase [Parvibium lacunae]RCS58552.1 glutamyl-tRNA reductase [Parvibium lacunae]